MSFHRSLRGDDLHPSKIDAIDGSPIGITTPEFVGEMIVDSTNKVFYRSTGLTSSDWELIGGAGDISTLGALSDVDISGRQEETILEWDEPTQKYIHRLRVRVRSAGIVYPDPEVIDNGNGTITISDTFCTLYPDSNYSGQLLRLPVTGGIFTPVNNATSYLIVNYNEGSPIYQIITDVELINESNTIPVLTLYRIDNDVEILNWDSLADGLSNKLHMRFVKTDRFAHESGITLSESTGRVVKTTEGKVWYGAVRTSVPSFSSDTDTWEFWYHNAGVWERNLLTNTYNNTQYDNGTNLVNLSPNNYTVNWIFRDHHTPSHGAYILGSNQYSTLADARSSQPPSLPPKISSIYFLVGRIIVVRDGTTASAIETAFTKTFIARAVTSHNNLSGLNDGDYKHLTATEYSNLGTLAGQPILPAAKYHRVASYDTPSANVWHDVIWDTNNTEETTFGFSRSGAEITCQFNGITNINGCIRSIWNGSASQWEFVTIHIRAVSSSDGGSTWDEMRCVQTVGIRARQVGQTSTLRYGGTFLASNGLIVKIQYQVTDALMDLQGSPVFDDPVSASIHLEYITRI